MYDVNRLESCAKQLESFQGYLILAWAESSLPTDIWIERFRAIDWSKFDATTVLHYADPAGEEETRKRLAMVINKFFRPNSRVSWDEVC